MNHTFDGLGFYPADILLPREGTDLTRWSVVACDQYTSQPEYWQRVEDTVGDCPSALRLILPESRLSAPNVQEEIQSINRTMEAYQQSGLFRTLGQSLIYLRRTQQNGVVRQGLVGMVDLEDYDYTPGAGSLIRATEGTVLSRIPPRVAVRENAGLELPHVMLLIDDRSCGIIEPLADQTNTMAQVYDFDLMEDSGHLTGWQLTPTQMEAVASGLSALKDPAAFAEKYQVEGMAPLLFAVGDGNHSLATAKTTYQQIKAQNPADAALARYALVEVVNLHDVALEFEPIHRVVFGVDPAALLQDMKNAFPGAYEGEGEGHGLHYVYGQTEGVITVPNPTAQLPVGTLQTWLDAWLAENGGEVDYIHGEEVTRQLAARPQAVGFLLPPMSKYDLFRTVICDGVLPRKTFSMGEACDKRFYLEARKIR